MEQFKFLTVIDPHASDKTPGSRIDSYIESFLGKLDQINEIAKRESVSLILMTGDLFSDKDKSKNSHFLTSSFVNKLLAMPCPVYGILGNHDLWQNRFDSWESQPVSNLIKSGAYNLLDFGDYYHTYGNGKKIKIRGFSYDEQKNYSNVFIDRGDEDLLIQVTHFSVSPEGGVYSKYSEKMYSYQELKDAPPDIFVLGHIHNDYGITTEGGKVFVQHGSLMRSSTHCYNLDRDVKVGLVTVNSDLSIQTKEIPLRISPSVEIFSLEKKIQIDRETKRVEEFLEKLAGSVESKGYGGAVSVESLIEGLELDVEERKLILEKYLHYMALAT